MIDKENGGSKADASNAGINAARYPIFYCGDADSILDPARARARRAAVPRGPDARSPAAGRCASSTAARCAAACWRKSALPKNPLALVQVVEYLRAFLGGRLGWSAINGMLIVSGAFGVFHRDTVVEAGGYRARRRSARTWS